MFIPELACLEIRESTELPANTLVAPLSVIREIRLVLGRITIEMRVGREEVVVVSSDLFEAFNAWSDALDEPHDEGGGEDTSWLN